MNFIRIGDEVINLDNVMLVDLNWTDDDGDSHVVFEFVMRGQDELDEGRNITQPYLRMFKGKAAEAIRRHFRDSLPDLLAEGQKGSDA
jgi:hypothetical protein